MDNLALSTSWWLKLTTVKGFKADVLVLAFIMRSDQGLMLKTSAWNSLANLHYKHVDNTKFPCYSLQLR